MLANLKIICQFHAHPLNQNSVNIFWAESSPRVPDYCAYLRSRHDLAAAILYACLQGPVISNLFWSTGPAIVKI